MQGSTEVIAIDLRPLRPLGANGGIKPAIFSLIAEAGRQKQDSVVFVFLTNSASHSEVRELARPRDILLCILDDPGAPLDILRSNDPLEMKLKQPPEGFMDEIGVDLLYCPFGETGLHSEGIPTVAMITDLLHLDYPYTLSRRELAERRQYVRGTVRNATKIQGITLSGIERLIHHFKLPRSSLFFTHLPVHERLAGAVPESTRETAGTPPGGGLEPGAGSNAGSCATKSYFFYPANIWFHKNHETLLLGYQNYLHKAGAGAWDLVFTCHENEQADKLRELAGTLGLADHVVFKGHVPERELHELWRHAGALVFPSLHEGFGIPIVEAMHHEVPIISSWEYSLKEVVADACLLIDPRKPLSIASALYEMSTDENLRKDLIRRGKIRLGFFDLKTETKKLMDVFTSLITDHDHLARIPAPLEGAEVFRTPTPASAEVWRIEIRFAPCHIQNRYSIYLDNCPYGAFCTATQEEGVFAFDCIPAGRVLGIAAGIDRAVGKEELTVQSPLKTIGEIVAFNSAGDRLLLYTRETTAHHEG